jgi:hypothetical protein
MVILIKFKIKINQKNNFYFKIFFLASIIIGLIILINKNLIFLLNFL